MILNEDKSNFFSPPEARDLRSTVFRLEHAQKSVVGELEDQVKDRTDELKDTALTLFSIAVKQLGTKPTTEQLEEIIGKCPLDSLEEEEFNEFLDTFQDEWATFTEEAADKEVDVDKWFQAVGAEEEVEYGSKRWGRRRR